MPVKMNRLRTGISRAAALGFVCALILADPGISSAGARYFSTPTWQLRQSRTETETSVRLWKKSSQSEGSVPAVTPPGALQIGPHPADRILVSVREARLKNTRVPFLITRWIHGAHAGSVQVFDPAAAKPGSRIEPIRTWDSLFEPSFQIRNGELIVEYSVASPKSPAGGVEKIETWTGPEKSP